MISLNINVLSEDQLLALACSLFLIIEGLPDYSHIKHEYEISYAEIELLYINKTGHPFKLGNPRSLDNSAPLTQAEIIENIYNQ